MPRLGQLQAWSESAFAQLTPVDVHVFPLYNQLVVGIHVISEGVMLGLTVHIEEPGVVSITAWNVRNRQESGCEPGSTKLQDDLSMTVYRAMPSV